MVCRTPSPESSRHRHFREQNPPSAQQDNVEAEDDHEDPHQRPTQCQGKRNQDHAHRQSSQQHHEDGPSTTGRASRQHQPWTRTPREGRLSHQRFGLPHERGLFGFLVVVAIRVSSPSSSQDGQGVRVNSVAWWNNASATRSRMTGKVRVGATTGLSLRRRFIRVMHRARTDH